MTPEDVKKRLRAYALRCVKLAAAFPKGPVGDSMARQLARAGPGAAANYRAACIARSSADFVAKLGLVEEEADESVFWIGLAAEAGLVKPARIESLLAEGNQIVRIIAQSRKTARQRLAMRRNARGASGRT